MGYPEKTVNLQNKLHNYYIMKKFFSLAIMLMAFVNCIAANLEGEQVKYTGFKSGIITYELAIDTMTGTEVDYIDNYGNDYFVYQNFPGFVNSLSTVIDSIGYEIFLDKKTGFKYKSQEPMNWLNLTESVISENKIKKVGQEEVLGRMCDKYTMVINHMGMTVQATAWIWKGITLKRVYDGIGRVYTQTATDVQIDVEIPAEKITIPEGIDYDN